MVDYFWNTDPESSFSSPLPNTRISRGFLQFDFLMQGLPPFLTSPCRDFHGPAELDSAEGGIHPFRVSLSHWKAPGDTCAFYTARTPL